MNSRLIRLLTALALSPSIASCAAAQDLPPLGRQTYEETFDKPASSAKFGAVYPGLATWGNFGIEPQGRRTGMRLSQAQRFTSRAWPGTLNVNVDANYCPGAATPKVADGALQIEAYRLAPADVATCGQGRRWASAYVASLPSFSQRFGYFEVDARLPCDAGRWSAFWLLPTSKTPENMGRLAEIDVFEHYGGPMVGVNQGRPWTINRVGQPFATLHSGRAGAEAMVSNSKTLPPLTDAQRAAFCKARHSFGVLWTPAEFRFYTDRRETFRTPNPGVDDPHYWVVNLDISERFGNPDTVTTPSRYSIYAVRAWALPN